MTLPSRVGGEVQEYSTIAAVDLGSNSFRLQVARVSEDHIYPLDSLRQNVRLGAGLTADKLLDADSQARAIECLKLFGERLRGLAPHAVRAVGTNTLRVAKNAPAFLAKAQAALGFPIEVIAGREEARLIYLGVAHSLPASREQRLVVDIGGGSTELIIGVGIKPRKMESLYMGCVSHSRRFFPGGKISKAAMQAAETAARLELQSVEAEFSASHWREAVGSSGTARALADILEQGGHGGISADGLEKLRQALLKAGDCKRLDLPGLKEERRAVIPGGFAIMAAIFAELGVEHMTVASGALREGVLYDLVGRFHHRDMRDATVDHLMRRYQVDSAQATRVEQLSAALLARLSEADDEPARQRLAWAARLHEIGISIAHSGYHKHGAYILEHADMPGFSKMEQGRLSVLVRAQRGSLAKVQGLVPAMDEWAAILALRLAVIMYRSRMDLVLPEMHIQRLQDGFRLKLDKRWIKQYPLTAAALQAESREWATVGLEFALVTAKYA